MTNSQVKICGITTITDANFAISFGADYLGFIFYPKSKRYISYDSSKEIIDVIKDKIKTVAVTVDPSNNDILEINPMFTTIHCTGGRKMMTECMNLKKEMNSSTNIIGVTMLTSFDDQEINEIGFKDSVPDSINKLAGLANDCGLDGLVCSPLEVNKIKSDFPQLKLIVPGIRRPSDETNDQKRTLSANEAVINGADILVIGRPITESADPAKAAAEFSYEVQ